MERPDLSSVYILLLPNSYVILSVCFRLLHVGLVEAQFAGAVRPAERIVHAVDGRNAQTDSAADCAFGQAS